MEWLPLIMFAVVCLVLMAGYPVAFTLGGTALVFAFFGIASGTFDDTSRLTCRAGSTAS